MTTPLLWAVVMSLVELCPIQTALETDLLRPFPWINQWTNVNGPKRSLTKDGVLGFGRTASRLVRDWRGPQGLPVKLTPRRSPSTSERRIGYLLLAVMAIFVVSPPVYILVTSGDTVDDKAESVLVEVCSFFMSRVVNPRRLTFPDLHPKITRHSPTFTSVRLSLNLRQDL